MSVMSSKESTSSKPKNKTFNKSQWRTNKYSHKSKVQQFEEKRRKSALHKYYKELKKSGLSGNSQQKPLIPGIPDKRQHRDINPYEKAKQELERRSKEKEEIRAERERQKAEREEALQKYKKEKLRKYKMLHKKTKKGQPVMAGRMEMLLEKIQQGIGS
ncbi:hypothetical protein ONE63_006316 [Megalurothrips usitatus]|uniref:Thyroid transcription factor 1-associated protein 26 n=1 Tax=Megalurothrips usitatus TaxID=439358 RepID=A0AAV7XTN0_9NEOP|nr:hypothetical protein ONE63_006316 [Megalurothrips usitatus]